MLWNRPPDRSGIRRWVLACALAGAVGGWGPGPAPGGVGAAGIPSGPGNGTARMAASPNASSVLVDFYDALLKGGDVAQFRRDVSARYNEGTLAKLLDSPEPKARRAAVLGLGLFGEFAASNVAVAGALKDKDPTVRALARDALWAIWFRADTPEHNEALARIRKLVDAGQLAEAIERAGRLIAEAPTFAEAYNQRAIAHFVGGDPAASAADCRLVLKLNPYHFGALGGLGQCLLQLDKRAEAVAVFRRASEIQPFDEGLKDLIAALDGGR